MFQVRIDNQKALSRLTSLKIKQIPFATSRALNATMFQAQASIRGSMPKRFTVRRPWIVRGILVEKSNKLHQTARVFSRDEFMAIHEEGGIKTPKQSKTIAVPTKHIMPNKRRVISKSKRPKALLRRKNVALVNMNGKPKIIRRLKSRVKILYNLVPRTRLRKRFKFIKTSEHISERRFGINFSRALSHAVRTAK